MVYIDDIIVASDTWQQHKAALKGIFKALEDNNFTLNQDKCHFCLPTMTILGFTFSADGIHLKGQHTKALREFPAPKTKKELERCLGLLTYFRKFIRNFATKAKPLTKLLRKESPFLWSSECNDAFKSLKTEILNCDCLQLPDYSQEFTVETDASDVGAGAILTQQIAGQTKIIEFFSKTFSEREAHMAAFEKEALAVVLAVEHWHAYLDGKKFTLLTDCQALSWLLQDKTRTGKTARWAIRLQQYDFDVRHRSGKSNVIPDALSRVPCEGAVLRIRTHPRVPEMDKQTLRTYQEEDKTVQRIKKALVSPMTAKTSETATFIQHVQQNYTTEEDIVYFVDHDADHRRGSKNNLRYLVPKSLKHTFLFQNHDVPSAGHLGVQKTLARLRSAVFWQGMLKDTKLYVRSCSECQLAKTSQKRKHGKLQTVLTSEPFQILGLDFVGQLPPTQGGCRYILTIVDYFTKWVWFVPTRHCTARTAAVHLFKEVIQAHGPPQHIVTDNGPAFVAKIFTVLSELSGIHLRKTTTYHPQANATERSNRTLKECLRTLVAQNQNSWGPLLPNLAYALRTIPHAATGETPFYLLYGRDPWDAIKTLALPAAQGNQPMQEYVDEMAMILEEARDTARAHMDEAARKMRKNYDRHRNDIEFYPRQLVKIKTHFISNADRGFNRKLAHKYHAPYRVLCKQGPLTYKLQNVDNKADIRTSTAAEMDVYYDPLTMQDFPEDEQDASDGEDENLNQHAATESSTNDSDPDEQVEVGDSDSQDDYTTSDEDVVDSKTNIDKPIALRKPARERKLPLKLRAVTVSLPWPLALAETLQQDWCAVVVC
jgi:transposase InsO family protein